MKPAIILEDHHLPDEDFALDEVVVSYQARGMNLSSLATMKPVDIRQVLIPISEQ